MIPGGRGRRIVVLLLLLLLAFAYGGKVYRKAGDFRNFHHRTRCAFAGETVYADEPYAVTYPPFFLFLVAPYAPLPFPAAKVAWYVTHLLLMVLLFRIAAGLLREETEGLRERGLFWFLLLLALSRFLMSHFENEQFDFVVALGVLGALELDRRGRPGLAGLALGASAAAKLTPLLFLAWVAYKRRWRLAATGALSFAGFLLLPDLVLAPLREGLLLRDWYDLVLVKVAPWEGGTPWAAGGKIWAPGGILNQSLSATALRFLSDTRVSIKGADGAREVVSVAFASLPPGVVSKLVYLADLVLIAPLLWVGRRSWRRTPLRGRVRETALVAALMLLFSPQTSKPHLVILVLGYGVLLADGLGSRRDRISLLFAALSFALATLTVDGLWGRHLGDLWQAMGAITLGVLLLALGLLRLLLRDRNAPESALS